MMQITIEIPEELGQQLQKEWDNLPRKLLESLAIEAYRSGVMTAAQIQVLLNFTSRWEVEEFLHQHQVHLDYTEADLEENIQTIQEVLSS
jgi:predicted HTH domain antitoxin